MRGWILLSILVAFSQAQCPWDDATLTRWSEYGPTSNVQNGDDVSLSGVNILLDVSTPRLNSLDITNGAKLVWDDQVGIELVSSWVHVGNGASFILGSEACRFTKKATITLIGTRSTAPTLASHGKKVFGISEGGTLELHGELNGPSWSKLDGDVRSFGHSLTDDGRGLNIVVVSAEGQILIDAKFDTYGDDTDLAAAAESEVVEIINGLTANSIIALAAKDSATRDGFGQALLNALQGLGSTKAASVNSRDSWAFVNIKSDPAYPVEQYSQRNSGSVSISAVFPTEMGDITIDVTSAGFDDGNVATIDTAGPQDPIITLTDAVDGWAVGDEVVLVSTDFNPHQAEKMKLMACPDCLDTQVRLNGMLQYSHHGSVEHGVDMRGEVAHLTRHILIRGEMESSCDSSSTSPRGECTYFDEDTFGGHLKVLENFENVHIEGVEFLHMGQQIMGSYPIHFHMAGDVDEVGGYASPTYVKNNAISHSFSRCVTIHGTHGLLVDNNVAYRHYGHCFFFEDGIEQRNVLTNNLGALTLPGSLLPTDRDGGSTGMCGFYGQGFGGDPTEFGSCNAVSTFWIENPNNHLSGNVAGGSEQTGFWYAFPARPTGPSLALGPDLDIRYTPLGVFDNNVAHSNLLRGLFFDDGVKGTQPSESEPEEFLSKIGMRYRPHQNADRDMPRVPAVIRNLTTYKNVDRGVWVRGGDFVFEDFYSAEQPIGMTLASEGTYPNDRGSSQQLHRGTFVGKSNNVGTADGMFQFVNGRTKVDNRPIRGFEYYDGPIVVDHAFFHAFSSDDDTTYAGIGWLLNNNWQHSPHSYISNACWDNVSNKVHFDIDWENYESNRDGQRNSIFMDKDGTTAGVAGAHVVPDTPYFTNDLCTSYPEWNNGAVCYYPEGVGYLYLRNTDTARTDFNGGVGGVAWVRDDASNYSHTLQGLPGTPASRFLTPAIYDHSYTVHFPHPTPPALRLSMVNWKAGKNVRVGICYSRNATVDTVRRYYDMSQNLYRDLQQVASIEELTTEGYYFDADTGLLFVIATTEIPLEDTLTYCQVGTNACERIEIAVSGPLGANDCANAYPKYAAGPIDHSSLECVGTVDEETGVCNDVSFEHCTIDDSQNGNDGDDDEAATMFAIILGSAGGAMALCLACLAITCVAVVAGALLAAVAAAVVVGYSGSQSAMGNTMVMGDL